MIKDPYNNRHCRFHKYKYKNIVVYDSFSFSRNVKNIYLLRSKIIHFKIFISDFENNYKRF